MTHNAARTFPDAQAGRPVLVLGLGRSGMAAARLLRRRGHAVTVIDGGGADAAERAALLRADGIAALCGSEAAVPEDDFALAVVSPGIPLDAPWPRTLAARGVPLVSELELGWRAVSGRILAITGSNGKSTLAVLCADALRAAGRSVRIGGNFGEPLCNLAMQDPPSEWLVLEVSSFQMETSAFFYPDIGIWLNLLPNHLDRHGDMRTYAALKARMFLNMPPEAHAVLFEDAARACSELEGIRCRRRTFGRSPAADARYLQGRVRLRTGVTTARIPIRGVFDNAVLGPAAAAAAAALDIAGVAPEAIAAAAAAHRRLPHRLQHAATINGVSFINDSKSTNLAALRAAVTMTPGPLRLLAGGHLKETGCASAIKGLRNCVLKVYLWGEASETLARAWSGKLPCRECASMEEAVNAAWRDARPGETILFSPGCSSLDRFRDFVERGETFQKVVARIREGAL